MQRCELSVKAKREYNGCCHVCDASQQLSFTVLGSPGEKVPVTLVAPQGEGEGADAGGALAGTIVVVTANLVSELLVSAFLLLLATRR